MAFFAILALCLSVGGLVLWLRIRRLADEVAELRRIVEGRPAATPSPTPPPPPVVKQTAKPKSEDWETLVGANWLNRVGSLVLVIGIALFLGYSLTQLGPVGKVTIGFTLGVSMISGGLALERQDRYRNFALSLIGGGWAATYFTGYAMHGIEAARVVRDPVSGAGILLVISAAMILHALRYRSETATALAFLFAFASLNVTPVSTFSVVATAVLAASLLFLAHKFAWTRLAVAGAALTYLTFVLRQDRSIYGQYTLWIYWAMFECFDLLNRRGSLFMLNAAGFVGASLLLGPAMRSDLFFAVSAIAYVFSSVLRARLLPRPAQVWQGGYEGSVAAAATLMAIALVERYSGAGMALALLMEGEIVVLAGLAMRNDIIQKLGGIVLCAAFVRFVSVNVWSTESWTSLALLMAAVFTVNRVLRRGGPWYGAAAALLVGAVVAEEVSRNWVVVAWAGLAIAGLWAGVRFDQRDLRLQAYAGVVATCLRACLVNIYSVDSTEAHITAAVAVAVLYGGARTSFVSVAATSLLTMVLCDAVQGGLLTVALGFEGAVLLAAGFGARERVLRLSGLAIFLLCIAKLFAYDLREMDTLSRILSFVVLGVMLLAASWVYTRFREKIGRLL